MNTIFTGKQILPSVLYTFVSTIDQRFYYFKTTNTMEDYRQSQHQHYINNNGTAYCYSNT